MKRWITTILAGLLLLTYGIPAAALWWYSDSPRVAFRLRALRLKTLGALPSTGWRSLLTEIASPSFSSSKFFNLAIRNSLDSPEQVEAGRELFVSHCSFCHGEDGKGVNAPDLTADALQRRFDDMEIYSMIVRGVPGTEMPGFSGSSKDVLRLTAFVRSLAGVSTAQAESPRLACELCKTISVSPERLINAPQDAANWIMHSGAFHGGRFSVLDQINHRTVSRLRLKWVYQPSMPGGVRTVPLMIDGVMFLTGPEHEVIALNARSGEPFWTFERALPRTLSLCCGRINRGVAALGSRIYHATLDGHLIALDMATGSEAWDVEVADYQEGYSLTSAPLAVKDKVVVGMAGAEFPTRGFLDAYSAETGERAWRFNTIPGPGEPGHETWENDAWKTGGGSTWATGSYDPELNLLYWGVGNPAPLFDGEYRPGDNLYTSSVVALDPDTGELKWHYQFVPHDVDDWDAAITPILTDLEIDGRLRKVILWANRNCFFYILDRETGELLRATEYCKQTWNDGFTEAGRPIRRQNTSPTEAGTLVYPAYMGGSNVFAPAFNPITRLYYVNVWSADILLARRPTNPTIGRRFEGGRATVVPGTTESTTLRALDAMTGKIVWERLFEVTTRAGILATAGGLVFTGTSNGTLVALDAATGEEALVLRLGGSISSGPITYMLDGKQQLAVVSNGSVFVLEVAD
jgi:alcohol dehydrogenase (cytochrome c)